MRASIPVFHRNHITARVVLISAGVALLLGTALVVLILSIIAQRDAAVSAYRSQQALTASSQLEKSLISIENGLRGYVASGQQRFLTPTEAALSAYPEELGRLEALISDDPGQRRRVERIETHIEDYINLWARPLIALARERPDAARAVVVTRGGRQRVDRIRLEFEDLAFSEGAVSRQGQRRAEERSDLAVGVALGAFGLVVAGAAGLGYFLRRAVVRPVLDVAEASRRLSDGDLSTRVPASRDDEIGDLARAFNGMAEWLQSSRRQLAARTADLERSNTELEQFASITSHDLQAPLVTISMYAELLERKYGRELDGAGPFIDVIRQSTVQARELIRDLLEFSRTGRGEPELESVPVAEVVARALDGTRGAVEQAGARVTVHPLPTVCADRSSLCRVFQNLIGNAVKFSDEAHPEVEIGAERDGAFWRFNVRDNGIGMDPEHSERIFEPFKRLHGEERYPGTGIGLAVCQRIVAQHGGRIWVESRPGEGSLFSFTLPATQDDGEPAGEADGALAVPRAVAAA